MSKANSRHCVCGIWQYKVHRKHLTWNMIAKTFVMYKITKKMRSINRKFISAIPSAYINCQSEKINLKVDNHRSRGAKWFIYRHKHHNENHLLGQEDSCWLTLVYHVNLVWKKTAVNCPIHCSNRNKDRKFIGKLINIENVQSCILTCTMDIHIHVCSQCMLLLDIFNPRKCMHISKILLKVAF